MAKEQRKKRGSKNKNNVYLKRPLYGRFALERWAVLLVIAITDHLFFFFCLFFLLHIIIIMIIIILLVCKEVTQVPIARAQKKVLCNFHIRSGKSQFFFARIVHPKKLEFTMWLNLLFLNWILLFFSIAIIDCENLPFFYFAKMTMHNNDFFSFSMIIRNYKESHLTKLKFIWKTDHNIDDRDECKSN